MLLKRREEMLLVERGTVMDQNPQHFENTDCQTGFIKTLLPGFLLEKFREAKDNRPLFLKQ